MQWDKEPKPRGKGLLERIRDDIREKRNALEEQAGNLVVQGEARGANGLESMAGGLGPVYPTVFAENGEYFLKTDKGNMQIGDGLYEHLAAQKPLRIRGNFLYDGNTAIQLPPEVKRVFGQYGYWDGKREHR